MPLIFNYGSQSGWERGTGGMNRFLRDGGPLLRKFCLKSLHIFWGEEQVLVSRIDQMEKSREFSSGLLAGKTSFLMNEGILLWIQDWVIWEAWEGAESSCRN